MEGQVHPSNALRTLAAAVAHEVNNPLAVVAVNLHTMRRMLDTLEVSGADRSTLNDVFEILEECAQGAKRVSAVVDQLRLFSGPRAAEPDRLSPVEVLELCCGLLRPELMARVDAELAFAPTPETRAHATDLGRLLMNVLAEASSQLEIQARATNELRIATSTVGGDARITVRVAPADTDRPAGAGLDEAREVAAALGGRLEARHEGNARVLEVSLPAAKKATASQFQSHRGRVLILDDDRLVTRSTRRLLIVDHDVVVENDPYDALDLLARDDAFDALVVDLRMPRMSGLEFHALLVERHPACANRLVFMSGGADSGIVGPEGLPRPYLEKPVLPDHLRAVISELVAEAHR